MSKLGHLNAREDLGYRRIDYRMNMGEPREPTPLSVKEADIQITLPKLESDEMPIVIEHPHLDVLTMEVSILNLADSTEMNKGDWELLATTNSVGVEGYCRSVVDKLTIEIPSEYYHGEEVAIIITMVRGGEDYQYTQLMQVVTKLYSNSILPPHTHQTH